MNLPDQALTQVEVERYWRQDRRSLVICADRHSALVDFIEDRDSRLAK